ncbi:MAG: radical SAM family heme chaperone HemW [bacterium]
METVDSLYVHAPFCSRRCYYCDFAVKVGSSSDSDLWSRAIAGELQAIHEEQVFRISSSLKTLYVGGGTPSLLSDDSMVKLAGIVGIERLRRKDLEWTCEANPESFDKDKASAWIRAGVNRISLGLQTFQGPSLRWMGRLHGVKQSHEAVKIAREVGFSNVSVDVIIGLPPSLKRDLRKDFEELLSLEVDHVSLYGLTVENGTPLGRAVLEGKQDIIPDSQYREEYLFAVDWLESHGYRSYEISNFAQPGKKSKHNANYWSGKPYLGLGNGAHSYLYPIRRWNIRNWDGYCKKALEHSLPLENQENIDNEEHRLEYLWLGLRTKTGLRVGDFTVGVQERFASWTRDGLAVERDGNICLTPKGWLIMDHLTLELEEQLTDT